MKKSKTKKAGDRKKYFSPKSASKSTIRFHPNFIFIAFIVILVLLLFPNLVFDGERYAASDNIVRTITAHNVEEHLEKTGEVAYWDPKSWGGVPNVFDLPKSKISIDGFIDRIATTLSPAFVYFLLGGIGMFFFIFHLHRDRLIAFLAAMIFILIPYFKSLVIVGHIDKYPTIMYIPWIAWFLLRTLKKQTLSNILLLGLAVGLQIRATHYQVVFYTGFLVIALIVPWAWTKLKQKRFKELLLKFGSVLVAYGIGMLISAQPLFPTQHFSEQSMRAQPTLDLKKPETKDLVLEGRKGVEKSLVEVWSWEVSEWWSLLLSRAKGGISREDYNDAPTLIPDGKIPGYWGSVPVNESYYYIGGLAILLSLFACMFLFQQKLVLSLLILSLVMLLWTLGVHAGLFYDFCYRIIPYFKNFRTPITSISIFYFVIPALVSFGINALKDVKKFHSKPRLFWTPFIIMGILGLILFILYFLVPFQNQGTTMPAEVQNRIIDIRKSMYMTDLLKYFLLLGLGGGLILAYFYQKIKYGNMLIGITLLIGIDLLWVQSQYNQPTFTDHQYNLTYFNRSPAIEFLEQDQDVFRIFSYTSEDHRLSYFFQNIGNATNLQMSRLVYEILSNNLFKRIDNAIGINWNVLDFMNIKYVLAENEIKHPYLSLETSDPLRGLAVHRYKFSRPRGFFVNNIRLVKDPLARLELINDKGMDYTKTAILEEDPGLPLANFPRGTSRLEEYNSNYIQFYLETDKTSLFVISEVYAPLNQEVLLDGDPIKTYKTNHVIQSVIIPPGEHTLEIKYDAPIYKSSANISKFGFIVIYLLLALSGYYYYGRKRGWPLTDLIRSR